jgi:hypothetical protein
MPLASGRSVEFRAESVVSARETKDETPPRPWQTANPWISGLLAYLIPGAGHFYQGRHFKAVLYMVCILGSFFYGTSLADWKAVSYDQRAQQRNWGFIAQLGVGLPTLTAYVQSRRYEAQLNQPGAAGNRHGENPNLDALEQPLDEPFAGDVFVNGELVEVAGRIVLEPTQGELGSKIVTGRITGTDAQGRAVDLPVEGRIEIGPEIFASERRTLRIYEHGPPPDVDGAVPRPFLDWYQVPLEREQEQRLHQRLGKTYELALVYTWIAGLLNVLAVWDCVSGPAYGIGDEPEEGEEPARKDDAGKSDAEAKPPQPAPTETAPSPTA